MDKNEFTDRLVLAGQAAYRLAASYVSDPLPEELCYTVSKRDNPHGRRGPEGTMKFLGGRFLMPEDLRRLPAHRAASLLWVDGKVPAWINIGVCDYGVCDDGIERTELMLHFCNVLLVADPARLSPDFGMRPGNQFVPFRIRGPSTPVDWRSVELDGKVPLTRDRR